MNKSTIPILYALACLEVLSLFIKYVFFQVFFSLHLCSQMSACRKYMFYTHVCRAEDVGKLCYCTLSATWIFQMTVCLKDLSFNTWAPPHSFSLIINHVFLSFMIPSQ